MQMIKQDDDFREQIETIAKDIELLQSNAIIHIAERLSVANDLFCYRRNNEGFVAWVETRLNFSKSTAYRLLSVHERFNGESFQNLETLPREVLYLLAAPSTPDEVVEAVTKRVEAGEKLSVEDVQKEVAFTKHSGRTKPWGRGAKPRDNKAETDILAHKNKTGEWPTKKEGAELTGLNPRNFDNALRAAKAFEAGQTQGAYQEKMVSIHVLIEKLSPLFDRVLVQSKAHRAALSHTELAMIAGEGRRLLDSWASDDPTVRRVRGHVRPTKPPAPKGRKEDPECPDLSLN